VLLSDAALFPNPPKLLATAEAGAGENGIELTTEADDDDDDDDGEGG